MCLTVSIAKVFITPYKTCHIGFLITPHTIYPTLQPSKTLYRMHSPLLFRYPPRHFLFLSFLFLYEDLPPFADLLPPFADLLHRLVPLECPDDDHHHGISSCLSALAPSHLSAFGSHPPFFENLADLPCFLPPLFADLAHSSPHFGGFHLLRRVGLLVGHPVSIFDGF